MTYLINQILICSHHELAEKYIAEDKEIIKVKKQRVFLESYSINGVTKTVQTIKTPIPDRDGKIIGIIGVSRDITEEARSQIAFKRKRKKISLSSRQCSRGNLYS